MRVDVGGRVHAHPWSDEQKSLLSYVLSFVTRAFQMWSKRQRMHQISSQRVWGEGVANEEGGSRTACVRVQPHKSPRGLMDKAMAHEA